MNTDINAIIVEDNESYLQTIEKLVKVTAPHVRIIGKTTSLYEAEKLINELTPNLLFLDIEFEEEGKTAFDLLSQIENRKDLSFQIIFITAHQETSYYAQAFNYGALHFLEKPIDQQKLKEAIDRVYQNIPGYQLNDWLNQVQQVKRQWNQVHYSGKIIVEGTKFNEVVEIKDLVILEASGRYTEITLSGRKNICSSHNLGEFEKKLDRFQNFFRIHHNKIINLSYVARFSKKERIIELCPPFGNHIASKDRFRDFIKYLESNNFNPSPTAM